MRMYSFKYGVKGAFPFRDELHSLTGRASAFLYILQESLGLKAIGFDGDQLPSQVISHAVSAYGFNAPGLQGDARSFIMGHGYKALSLAVAGIVPGEGREGGSEYDYYGNQVFHEVSIP